MFDDHRLPVPALFAGENHGACISGANRFAIGRPQINAAMVGCHA
jgi:hypothetical protein